MVAASATLVEAAGVAAVEIAHSCGEVRLGRLDDEVVVRAEEAVGVDPPRISTNDAAEELEEEAPVLVVPEDEGAAVPARGDVVVRACLLVAKRPGHRFDVSGRSGVDRGAAKGSAQPSLPRHVPGKSQGRSGQRRRRTRWSWRPKSSRRETKSAPETKHLFLRRQVPGIGHERAGVAANT